MEFNQPKGIYLQIADQMCDRILQGEWLGQKRIPSIRELAINLRVNPNTVTRSYQMLIERKIIENQRGIGYFVSTEARQIILQKMKDEFLHDELPRLFKIMNLLDIDIGEIADHFKNHKGGKSNEK